MAAAILYRASAAIPPGGKIGLIGAMARASIIRQIEPDEGRTEMPRRIRLGYIAQDAPSDSTTPVQAMLAADVERAQLLEEAETCAVPAIGWMFTIGCSRSTPIAPLSRAVRILTGLGFDEAMQEPAAGFRLNVPKLTKR